MLLTSCTPALFLYFGLLPQLLSALDLIVPKTVDVKLGDRFEIPCFDSSNTDVQVEWFWEKPGSKKRVLYMKHPTNRSEDGFTFGTQNYSMVMRVARLLHNSEYTCRVRSKVGTKEETANLRVYVQPGIQIKKTDKPIEVDDSLAEIARCTISEAYPKPDITWYKNEVQLKQSDENVDLINTIAVEDEKYSGESVLKYRVHKDDDQASYYCNVQVQRTGDGINSSTVQVTLHYPADEVNVIVSPEKIAEGKKATITCKTNGNPPPPIILSKDGEELQNPVSEQYTIEHVSRKHHGTYQCAIKTSKGNFISKKTIIIHYLDPVSLQGFSLPVNKGENISLTCSAHASGSVDYRWKKDDVLMTTDKNQQITNADYQDSGKYTCSAKLADMPELQESESDYLTIQGSPELLENQTVSHVMLLLSSKYISCHANAFPKPGVNWEGAIVEESNKSNYTNGIFHSEIALKQPWEIFIYSRVTCKIHNNYGSIDREYKIISLFYVIFLFLLLIVVIIGIVCFMSWRKRTSNHGYYNPRTEVESNELLDPT
uniref:Ig-like domain-containing protein n=1 Tax=Eptatretus burgeri TaxID=7764 RepID=A0A8C4NGP7_EPTBU